MPAEVILETSHGRRSMDTLREICPERANWECLSPTAPASAASASEC